MSGIDTTAVGGNKAANLIIAQMNTLSAETVLGLFAQREFPTGQSLIGSLVILAIQTRNANKISISLLGPDSFVIKDNGRMFEEQQLKSVYQTVSGVANLDAASWNRPSRSYLVLKGGWIRLGSHAPENLKREENQGALIEVSKIFERLPVRRRCTPEILIHEAIREQVIRLCLMYPSVEVRLTALNRPIVIWNGGYSKICRDVFGELVFRAEHEGLVDFAFEDLYGIISANVMGMHHSRSLQFVLTQGSLNCGNEDEMKEMLNKSFRELFPRKFIQLTNIENRTYHLVFVIVFRSMTRCAKKTMENVTERLLALGSWDSYRRRSESSGFEAVKGEAKPESRETSLKSAIGQVAETDTLRSIVKLDRDSLIGTSLVGQLNNEFIIIRTASASTLASSLLFLDQHAADERIRFERLQEDVLDAKKNESVICTSCLDTDKDYGNEVETLIFQGSSRIRVTQGERLFLDTFQKEIETWGFRWAFVPGNELLVFEVPFVLGMRLPPSALLEMAQELCSNPAGVPSPFRRLLASRACRGAIMFGQPLTETICLELLVDLAKCRLPFQCAHGRPSLVPSKIQL